MQAISPSGKSRKHPAGCLYYVERGTTWVARQLMLKSERPPELTPQLAAIAEKLDAVGMHPETADRLARDKKGRRPRVEYVEGASPAYRKFYPLEDLVEAAKAYAAPPAERDRVRPPAEIKQLTDADFINLPEALSLGFTEGYLREHCDLEDKRRKDPATPAPPIGRLIHGEWRDRISTRSHRVRAPWFQLRDLRECIDHRDNPPQLPKGTVLLRDAMPKLGMKIGEQTVRNLIAGGVIGGGIIDGFKRNFAPARLWYMVWEDREKIPRVPREKQPGFRVFWIDGRDYYPTVEARKLSGATDFDLTRRWLPTDHGGMGEPCPHTGRPVTCRRTEDDELLVFAGDDLRTIAEALTGTRPKAPTKPPQLRAIAAPANGDGHQEPETASPPADGFGEDRTLKACLLRKQNPEWTDLQVAKAAGFPSSGTLSRNQIYQQAKKAYGGDRSTVRRGWKKTNGDVDSASHDAPPE